MAANSCCKHSVRMGVLLVSVAYHSIASCLLVDTVSCADVPTCALVSAIYLPKVLYDPFHTLVFLVLW